jgi:hypothetical protein
MSALVASRRSIERTFSVAVDLGTSYPLSV